MSITHQDYVRLRDEGLTITEIAKRLGVSKQAVSYWFKCHFPGYLSATRANSVARRYFVGATLCGGAVIVQRLDAELVLRCPCGHEFVMTLGSVVVANRRRSNILCASCRHRALSEKRQKVDPALIVADYRAGMTWEQIAKKHGYKTTKSVADALKRAGVPTGRNKGRSWDAFDPRYQRANHEQA